MKYRIKDETLAKLVYAVFDKEDVHRKIAGQIEDGYRRIVLSSGDAFHTKLNREHGYLKNTYSAVSVSIDKKEIEKIPEHNLEGWNPWPEVTPSEPKKYLVQLEYTRTGEKVLATADWEPEDNWFCYGNEHDRDPGYADEDVWIVAFRELPDFYQPEEQE